MYHHCSGYTSPHSNIGISLTELQKATVGSMWPTGCLYFWLMKAADTLDFQKATVVSNWPSKRKKLQLDQSGQANAKSCSWIKVAKRTQKLQLDQSGQANAKSCS